MWKRIVINPDGSVSPCCAYYPQKYDFGEITNSSVKECGTLRGIGKRGKRRGAEITRDARERPFVLYVPCSATSSTCRRMIKTITDILYYITISSRLSALKLRKEANKARRIAELVELAFNYSFTPLRRLTIKPAQVKEEVTELLRILKSLNPKACLEIGTAGGGTLFLFAQVARPDALLVSIDLPGGPFGGGYPAWKIPLYKSFTRYATQRIYLLRSDSHDPSTLRKVREILGDTPLDFLFIDGDHTYEGVKKDFEMYSPLVRKGGIIAFHDIVPGPPENVGGVPRFWQEIKYRYKHIEIIHYWNQDGFGIGVLFKE